MRVVSSREVRLAWSTREGKPCESVPAVVQKEFAEELKRLQREAKDASTMLAAQALRLERSPLDERSWPLEIWRKRFLDHPLLGTLVRRLIWKFDNTLAVSGKDGFMDVKDRVFAPKRGAKVSLWHPIHSRPDEIVAWRQWLQRREV